MNYLDQIVKTHFADLVNYYEYLGLEKSEYFWVVKGLLEFHGIYKEISIHDSFEIEMIIPHGYPEDYPVVKEMGGGIPPDFHKFPDGSLCLGVPFQIRKIFKKNPNLIGFTNDLLIPYLYSFSFWKQHGTFPYGELSHAAKGIMEYYMELFNVNSETVVLKFLKILATGKYRGHLYCPCGSGFTIRHCHGDILLTCKDVQSQLAFADDCLSIMKCMHDSNIYFSRALLVEVFQCFKKLLRSKNRLRECR